MYRVFFLSLVFVGHASASFIDSHVFINEFHYDNAGSDKTEFVEVVAPVSLADLSSVTLTLYNGNGGTVYAGPTALDAFTQGDVVDGFAIFSWDLSMQNGAPDGLALAMHDEVLQFLSYEGTFMATNGVAAGLTSTDVGVAEDSSTPLGFSLQLAGAGDSYFDFSWQPAAPHTRGVVNHDQSFVVPEPASVVSWLAVLAAITGTCWWRRGWSKTARNMQAVIDSPPARRMPETDAASISWATHAVFPWRETLAPPPPDHTASTFRESFWPALCAEHAHHATPRHKCRIGGLSEGSEQRS
jgi:hypothetical protein